MVQLAAQQFLTMAEKCNNICFFDLETNGFDGDYSSLLVGSIRPFRGPVKTFTVDKVGNDAKVAAEIRDELHKYTLWVSFYGRGFDALFLQCRLLVNNLPQLEKRLHLDLYFSIKNKIKTSRHSQAHYLELLGTKNRKMTVSPNSWNDCLDRDHKNFKKMIARCESDTIGLRELYTKVRHLIIDISK